MRLAIPTVIAQLVNMLLQHRGSHPHRPHRGHRQPRADRRGRVHADHCDRDGVRGAGRLPAAPRASIAMGAATATRPKSCWAAAFAANRDFADADGVLLLFGHEFLLAFGASENTIEYADNYLNIYAFGTLFGS